MNTYCEYLSVSIPLFKEKIDICALPKVSHYTLDKSKYLSIQIQEWFAKLNLDIVLVEVFYTKPHETGVIHIDSFGGDYTKLNWQLGGVDSYMMWYSYNVSTKSALGKTPIGSNYSRYESSEVTQVHTQSIQSPSLVQVGIPHNIQNFNEDRWVISIVYRQLNFPFSRPTWNESLNIFKDYITK